VSGVVAEARHRLALAPGLKDATGKPFVVKDWAPNSERRNLLSPQISERQTVAGTPANISRINVCVRLDEAAQHIYFKTARRAGVFPVEVIPNG